MAQEKLPFFMVWSQENCFRHEGIFRPDKNHVIADFKPLSFIWRYFYPSMDESNTILIDDSPYKACMNNPSNCIFPKPFDGWYGGEVDDYLKKVLWPHLEGMKLTLNIQQYIKDAHFGQCPINESHHLYKYFYVVINNPWDSTLPSAPEQKTKSEVLLQRHSKKKKFQSIYEELDAEQILILHNIQEKNWENCLARGQAISFAIHLGLKKDRFSVFEAKSYIKQLTKRLRQERGL